MRLDNYKFDCSSVPLFKILLLVESLSRKSMAGELLNELKKIECLKAVHACDTKLSETESGTAVRSMPFSQSAVPKTYTK